MYAVKQALGVLIRLVDVLIILRILLSFLPNLRASRFAEFIYQMTEPILAPCRALLDKLGLGMGMFDFSPLLAYLVMRIIEIIVYSL